MPLCRPRSRTARRPNTFTGPDTFARTPLRRLRLRFSDGALTLMQEAACGFVYDQAARAQLSTPAVRASASQLWTLIQHPDGSGLLVCRDRSGTVLYKNQVPDCRACGEVAFYYAQGFVFLPDENAVTPETLDLHDALVLSLHD